MSRRYSSEGSLFIGRLNKNCRVRDLEDVFEPYGKLSRCEIKYGIGNSLSCLAIYEIMYISGYVAAIIDFAFTSIIMSPLSKVEMIKWLILFFQVQKWVRTACLTFLISFNLLFRIRYLIVLF